MKKRWLDALERVFAAEIDNRLPFQSKAKVFRELEGERLVQADERTFGNGPFAVKCKGWCLTELGRLVYCTSCSETLAP